jgi:hypothetical protein
LEHTGYSLGIAQRNGIAHDHIREIATAIVAVLL